MQSELEPLLSVHIDLHALCQLEQLLKGTVHRGQSSYPNYRWIPGVDCSSLQILHQDTCSFFTAEQEGRSVVPHVECYPLLRDWLLSGACHGAGYMLVLHVVLVHSRKRLVAKRRLSWRSIYAGVACGACSFVVAKTWNSATAV